MAWCFTEQPHSSKLGSVCRGVFQFSSFSWEECWLSNLAADSTSHYYCAENIMTVSGSSRILFPEVCSDCCANSELSTVYTGSIDFERHDKVRRCRRSYTKMEERTSSGDEAVIFLWGTAALALAASAKQGQLISCCLQEAAVCYCCFCCRYYSEPLVINLLHFNWSVPHCDAPGHTYTHWQK